MRSWNGSHRTIMRSRSSWPRSLRRSAGSVTSNCETSAPLKLSRRSCWSNFARRSIGARPPERRYAKKNGGPCVARPAVGFFENRLRRYASFGDAFEGGFRGGLIAHLHRGPRECGPCIGVLRSRLGPATRELRQLLPAPVGFERAGLQELRLLFQARCPEWR